jgi:hypothetical protein
MATRRKKLTDIEKQRRAEQRARAIPPDAPVGAQLLYSREQTRHLLGRISLATIKRMEERGLLHGVRPSGAANGKVYFPGYQILAIRDGVAA